MFENWTFGVLNIIASGNNSNYLTTQAGLHLQIFIKNFGKSEINMKLALKNGVLK